MSGGNRGVRVQRSQSAGGMEHFGVHRLCCLDAILNAGHIKIRIAGRRIELKTNLGARDCRIAGKSKGILTGDFWSTLAMRGM